MLDGMQIGLTLPHYGFSLPGDAPISFRACAEWARRAEELGFDSVWVSDHFFYSFERYRVDSGPIASLEPMTTLAGVSAVTSRVRVGTLVLCATFRHPGLLAKAVAAVDRLSGGRLDIGLGAGWLRDEFEAFGYRFGDVSERFGSLEETLEVLDASSGGGPANVAGPTVSMDDAHVLPPPVRSPVPTFVGGKGGPLLLRLAARRAGGWNVVWRMAPKAYAKKVADVGAACAEIGRDPATFRLSVGLYSLLGADERDARAAFERGRCAMPGRALDADTYETWCADTLSGTPEQAIERIHAFEALGVQELIVAPWVLPFAVKEPEQVELFAARVLAPLRAGA
jgi:probable F420-dependent oxidoreductase